MYQEEVVLYGVARSRSCRRARRLLKRKGYAFKMVVHVTGDGEPGSRLPDTEGRETAPQVFVDGRMVGGLRELRTLDRSGDLDRVVHGEI